LSESDQYIIHGYPPFLRKLIPQGKLGLAGGVCTHISPTVHDTVDMYVHAYRGDSVAVGQYEARGFPADTGERGQFLHRIGDPASVVAEKYPRDFEDTPGLHMIKPDGVNQFLDPGGG